MALPQLNDSPSYEIKVPSTNQQANFRPFLVKEQKILMMAMETQDDKQILKAITDTIISCSESPINVNDLTTFDVEYLFTQIRSKSVGETTTIAAKCTKCDQLTDVTINLADIKIDLPKNDNKKIKINDKYTLVMRYPPYSFMLEEDVVNGNQVDQMYAAIRTCLDTLETEEERISFREESKEEVEKFLDQMTTEQFNLVAEFVSNIPKLQHSINFKCDNCQEDNVLNLTGIQDFF